MNLNLLLGAKTKMIYDFSTLSLMFRLLMCDNSIFIFILSFNIKCFIINNLILRKLKDIQYP